MKLLFKTITGSRLYGIHTAASDTDMKGFAFPEPSEMLGLSPDFEQDKTKDEAANSECEIWALRKFFRLACKGNPTVLEVAFAAPEYTIFTTNTGEAVRKFVRENCITKHVFPAYRCYLDAQIRKLQRPDREGKRQALIDKYGYDTKFAGHAMRLALQCYDVLTTGVIKPTLDSLGREMVMDIRAGNESKENVLATLTSSAFALDKAWDSSIIREKELDWDKANEFITGVHLGYINSL